MYKSRLICALFFSVFSVLANPSHASVVWLGANNTNNVARYDFSGSLISQFGSTTSTGGMVIVGNEVWIGADDANNIARYDFSGSLINQFLTPTSTGDLAIVGNEVWLGSNSSNNVARYNFSGSFLGQFSATTSTGGIAAIVPIPPALLLFSSGLLGLVGFAKKKTFRKNIHPTR